MKVDRNQFFGSKTPYLKAADLRNGQSVTVEKTDFLTIGRDSKLCLYFKGIELPLPLNATNFDSMVAKFGDDTDKWLGQKLRITITTAPNPQAGGKPVPAIRL